MDILIKNATIVDSSHNLHFLTKDILIINGVIKEIDDKINVNDIDIISKKNLHISTGWFDPSVCFGEPGYEERETITNGLKTAGLSGFTQIGLNPNTNPIIDNILGVNNLINFSEKTPTKIRPVSALTIDQNGRQLVELSILKSNGAIGFGDYKKPIINSNLLKIALKYSQKFNGLIFSYPNDINIVGNGIVNEGIVSAKIGLPGIPKLSEIIQIQRDIEILKYSGGSLLIPYVTTSEGVELIRNAKKHGLNIYSTTSIMHLLFSDNKIEDFDATYKFFPPLRSKSDSSSLREGLIDGTIDMATSMHEPVNKELKNLSFINSLDGSIGLEAVFGVLCKLFPLEKVIQILTRGRRCFNLEKETIKVGSIANITLFDPDINWTFSNSSIKSKSKNCAFINEKMQGKVYGVINDNKILLNS